MDESDFRTPTTSCSEVTFCIAVDVAASYHYLLWQLTVVGNIAILLAYDVYVVT
jgi:hypothetical protein